MVAGTGVVSMSVGVFGSSLIRLASGTNCIVGFVAMVGCFVAGHVWEVVVDCAFESSVYRNGCRSCVLAGFDNHT
jgi:hypothetical protein